ncbi:hypothetical protein MOQ_005104 [Trypanosoma cruzi marinkellei]|uniref:Uncharacterized protein n=1 Tax=Trypanosoma cruzi marinkellei TaxID=85056 RepID=K2MZ90_TRYCR|nr:hypothetical protein MOQ_005104 [Trypanosoma cruzi marinkellei]
MDDDYDNFDEYNDAADDWEAEAAEEEAHEKEILEQKANIEEQKLRKRIKAPAKVKKEEEEEEAIAADIAAALITMKEKASSAGEAMHLLLGNGDEGARRLIADMPVKTEQDATELGEAIAKRLLTFSRQPHFNTMLGVVFQDFAHEFRTRYAANMEATRVHVSSVEAKRRIKKAKKTRASNHHDDAATIETTVNKESVVEKKDRDALDFDAVNDAGGAAGVSIEEEDFM